MRRTLYNFALLAFVLCLLPAATLPAAIVGTGDVSPTLPWNSATIGYVGNTSDGDLTVNLGTILYSNYCHLGYNSSSTGTAMVTGTGSKWTNGSDLYVGSSGTGTLEIEAGGLVSNRYGYLGYNSTSTGTATVTGTGSTWTNNSLYVGNSGTGTLTIDGGGLVSDNYGYLAYNSGSTGTATVTGSKWTNSSNLYIGNSGTGMLKIEAGGLVSTSSSYLGYNSSSTGTVTVTDAGSKWTNNSNLDIGYNGTGTLKIEAGGLVSNNYGILGLNSGSTGTVTVTGAGSTWTNNSRLYIGYDGTGTLKIDAGGLVSNISGYLSSNSDSTGTATVTGAGSTWTNSSDLYVGNSGVGTLTIEAGGLVSNSTGYLGYNLGSSGTATVTGAGSTWTNSSGLYVGYNGTGTLTVDSGATVTATTLYASFCDLLGNGTITTKGAVLDADFLFDATHPFQQTFSFGSGGSLKVNPSSSGDLGAGYKGTGTLRIADGIAVSSSSGYIAYRSGSTGTATVTGARSTWNDMLYLVVGDYGTGSLRIEAGGQVWDNYGHIGRNPGSSGTATVTGAGSTWTNLNYLTVGGYGTGSLKIEAGGRVNNISSSLGYESGSTGTATVTGTGSNWKTGSFSVGSSGAGTLKVEAGGQADSSYGYLGYQSGSAGTATVTGAGSQWGIFYELYSGYGGTGTLKIEAGGQVSSNNGYLGYYSGSTGAATITGTGSTWTTNSRLYIGYNGTGTLTVDNGATVTAGTLYASFANLLGNGTITTQGAVLDADLVFDAAHPLQQTFSFGTGGSLKVNPGSSADLGAGHKGTGTLRIADGIAMSSAYGYLAYLSGSTGAATVTGAGSSWTTTGELYVGRSGTGTLKIEGGGQVNNTYYGYIGYVSGSTGTATVTGAGSNWTNNGTLYVGYNGAGTLKIEAGGQVSSSYGYVGSTSTATVTGTGSKWTNGGNLYAGGSGTGMLKIEAGGTVITKTLLLANSSGSTGTCVIDSGGILQAETITVSSVTAKFTWNDGTIRNYNATTDLSLPSSNLTLRLAATGTHTFNIDSGRSGTIGAMLVDATTQGTLSKTGPGTLVLTNANTHSGDTIINAGTLQLGNNLALQNSAIDTSGAGSLVFSSGVNTPTFGGLTGSGNLTLAANVTGLTLNTVAGATKTYSGTLGSATPGMTLTKTGLGTQVLSGANTYTGTTTVRAGTLILSGDNSTNSGLTTVSGGTLILSGDNSANSGLTTVSGGTLTLSSANALGSGGSTVSSGTLNINHAAALGSGRLSLSGGTIDNTSVGPVVNLGANPITVSESFVFTGTESLDLGTGPVTLGATTRTWTTAANTLTVGGTLSGGAGLTKSGAGVLALSGNSAYTGTTTVSAGTLVLSGNNSATTGLTTVNGGTLTLGSANALGAGGVTLSSGTLNINNPAALGSGRLTLSGGTINNTSVGPIVNLGTNPITVGGNLTFTGTQSLDLGAGPVTLGTTTRSWTITANTLTVGGGLSGTAGVTKAGLSTLALSGTNTYTGPTTIHAGTLALGASSSINNSTTIIVGDAGSNGATLDVTAKSSYTISAGQTLKGIGTVNIGAGKTVTNNGILATGNSIGTLNVTGNYTFGSTSTWQVETDATTSDQITISGAATITSGAKITFSGTTGAGNYVLATANSGLNSGTFTATAPTGYALKYSDTELDLQHFADQALTSANPAVLNIMSGTTASVSATLTNSAPSGSAALGVTLADNGGTGGTVSNLTSSTGSTVATGSPSTISGTFTAGAVGRNQTWSIKNTNANAVTNSASGGGTVNVYTHASASLSDSTLNYSVLRNAGNLVVPSTVLSNTGGVNAAGLQITSMTAGLSGIAVNQVVDNTSSVTVTAPAINTANYGSTSRAYTIGLSDAQNIIGFSVLSNKVFTVNANVGEAKTGANSGFGDSLTALVKHSESYAGLESTVVGATGSTAPLGTAATLLAGANNSTDGNVSMAWRNRTADESNPSKRLDLGGGGLVSDVLDLRVPGSSPFVLRMSYSKAEMETIWGDANGRAFVARLIGDNWENAGDLTMYHAGAYDAAYANDVGAWGYDLGNPLSTTGIGTAWVVLNQGGTFAVVSEPSTFALLGMGAVGLMGWAWRKRKA